MELEVNKDREPMIAAHPFGVRVLLVDHDARQLTYQAGILEQQGLHVVTSTSYAAAVRLLERDGFDFVVVSQGGPRFEGRCVLERAMLADPQTPVLVVAGWADMNAYVEAMRLGAVDYLEKPVNPWELVRTIKRHLRLASIATETPLAG